MPNFPRLRAQLAQTGLAQTNISLYQVIDQLIDFITKAGTITNETTTVISGDVTAVADALAALLADFIALQNSDFITYSAEVGLPNSRNLLAGTGVTFDDSIAGERTINGGASGFIQWDVLTDGDLIEAEIVFAGGSAVMVHTP